MNMQLKKINECEKKELYEMYKDFPSEEVGSVNDFVNANYKDFIKTIEGYNLEENEINPDINTKTSRYIVCVDNKLVGELGIRTTQNDFWVNKGSQIFYKIRIDYRGHGYGNEMLKLGLIECKKLGFKQVRINCDDNNIKSKKIIVKLGGVVDIQSYKTKIGHSSSYIIKL